MGSYIDKSGNIQVEGKAKKSDMDLLEQAKATWEHWADFRERRARSRNYYRGRPEEMVWDPDTSSWVAEDDIIADSGRVPTRVNQIGPTIRNLKGQFRQIKTQRLAYGRNREDNEASEQATEALRASSDSNQTESVDVEAFEESLVSGLYGWKVTYKWIPRLNLEDCYVQRIDVARFFMNPDFSDRRLDDVRIIGEIHDLPIEEVVSQFAKSKADEKRLRKLYDDIAQKEFFREYSFGFDEKDALDFLTPIKPDLCRVIEVWKLEYGWRDFLHDRVTGTFELSDMSEAEVKDLNMMRAEEAFRMGLPQPPEIEIISKYEGIWHVTYLTPNGDILWEADNPYWHETHPYVLGVAQMFDGEIWGLIEDLIDPQRLVNRITQAIDYMFGASAKGVLLVPEEAIPDGVSLQEFASEWTRFGGVIRFKAKPGVALPQQITAKAIPDGIFLWLDQMHRAIKESSGVQGAQLGQAAPSGTPGNLYQAQIQQSQTTNRDFIDSFFEIRRQRDLKMLQVISQFYDEVRYVPVAGRRPDGKRYITYNPSRVRNITWDVVLTEATDTAATRQLFEDQLVKFLDTNRLTFRQFLALSSHPKADAIATVIERMNPLLMDDTQVDPAMKDSLMAQMMQQAQAGDPDAMALMTQAR